MLTVKHVQSHRATVGKEVADHRTTAEHLRDDPAKGLPVQRVAELRVVVGRGPNVPDHSLEVYVSKTPFSCPLILVRGTHGHMNPHVTAQERSREG